MSRVLLINPTITAKRNARFPLAVLSIATAIEPAHQARILDGNIDRDFVASAVRALAAERFDAVGITVMGGPQLPPALQVSEAIRAAHPSVPIIWGGHFPTVCPEPALAEPCVDFVIRAQGEDSFRELVDALVADDGGKVANIAGLSWKRDGQIVHNPDRKFSSARLARRLPIERLDNPRQYLGSTYLGRRTAGFQAAIGCRFRCTFCGIARPALRRTAACFAH